MKTNKRRFVIKLGLAIAAAALLFALAVSSYALGYPEEEDVYVSRESLEISPPWSEPVTEWNISREESDLPPWLEEVIDAVRPAAHDSVSLTPVGNLDLLDDITEIPVLPEVVTVPDLTEPAATGTKQFITVKTRSGKVFYIVIDRSRDTENVYFLNMVDDTDLFDITDGPRVLQCVCQGRCEAGRVNEECPVCRARLEYCRGRAPEPADTKQDDMQEVPDTQDTQKPAVAGNGAGVEKEGPAVNWPLIIITVVLLTGGTALYLIKFRKKPGQTGNAAYRADADGPDDFENNDDEGDM